MRTLWGLIITVLLGFDYIVGFGCLGLCLGFGFPELVALCLTLFVWFNWVVLYMLGFGFVFVV